MEYIIGTSSYFYMVALAGWWNTPTFSPIGVLSAFYDGNHFGFTCAGLGEGFNGFLLASGDFNHQSQARIEFRLNQN